MSTITQRSICFLFLWLLYFQIIPMQYIYAAENVKRVPLICYSCKPDPPNKDMKCEGKFGQIAINLVRNTILFQTLSDRQGKVLSSFPVSGKHVNCTIVDEKNWSCERQSDALSDSPDYFSAVMSEDRFKMISLFIGQGEPVPLFMDECFYLD